MSIGDILTILLAFYKLNYILFFNCSDGESESFEVSKRELVFEKFEDDAGGISMSISSITEESTSKAANDARVMRSKTMPTLNGASFSSRVSGPIIPNHRLHQHFQAWRSKSQPILLIALTTLETVVVSLQD